MAAFLTLSIDRGRGRLLRAVLLAASAFAAPAAHAAGDFALASCKGWNGTIVEREALDTSSARMRGIITKADLQEYCERDPGGETKQNGGKLTVKQCVDKYLRQEARTELSAQANCRTGVVSYQYGGRPTGRARFPLGPDADTSCASGLPPMIEQFKILCPAAAKRLKVDQ
ncbi:hypothetical protein VQ02_19180 [Methylobacterium variabile]|jgi:hypothetical protein|uniref:DUF3617 family protein n=1 Tax=Methylobacterium variabile TaxID=298794 RepID=A0A0J6SLW0_9HYPH|nr:hypothetical protein [Methylobacterium variabile]KMO34398.1 hypothetical protein VQ02_19180 [Methylobacterium variabile]